MSTIKRVAWADLGNVLTTELNSLGNGAYSALGTEYNNTSGLYLWGALEINLASLNPTTGAYLQLFLAQAIDGTNYEDPPATTNPAIHLMLPIASVTTGSATKRLTLGPSPGVPGFALPAAKIKFALLNGSGVSLAAASNTVKLWGAYDQVV